MKPRRTTSLLDFAIAACLAIVPILLGVVLLVAGVWPSGADEPGAPATKPWRHAVDRYVSVRHVAALKSFEAGIVERAGAGPLPSPAEVTAALPACAAEWQAAWRSGTAAPWRAAFAAGAPVPTQAEHIAAQLTALDAALQRFGARANARVATAVGFDAARWFDAAAQALAQPLQAPDYPGQPFGLRCSDLGGALEALLHNDARMLDRLAWRGTETRTVLARWRADQQVEIAPHHVARRNPWNGVAGCIYLGEGGEGDGAAPPTYFVAAPRSVQQRLCGSPALAGGLRAAAGTGFVPPSTGPERTGNDARVERAAAPVAPVAPAAAASAPRALAGELPLDAAPDDPRWRVPPSLPAMLAPLETLRQPTGVLYRLHTEPPDAASAGPDGRPMPGRNRARLNGSPVDIGLSVGLTIDPELQALAQRTAACYTGRHAVCDALGLRRPDDKGQPAGHALLEGAMVRMAAVAIVEVGSGRIQALAGALSPCARQEVDGPGRDAACDPRLPYPVQYRPDALLNPAVFHDAMPASTVKPIMAAAFLSDPKVGARWLATERSAMQRDAPPARESLRGQLLRSDSARFLDRMFCLDQGVVACDRAWAVQRSAAAFGWNGDCDAAPAAPVAAARDAGSPWDCGKHDLLFGRSLQASARPAASGVQDLLIASAASTEPAPMAVAYGRLMTQPRGDRLGAPMQLRAPAELSAAILRRCAAGADGRRLSDDDWEKCRGGSVVDVVAEGWGQGHARASALGIAGMMATLAAAANGQATLQRPHLVASIRGLQPAATPELPAALARWRASAEQPTGVAPEAAEVILSGLSYSHRIGTARTACEQVFDARRCRELGWLAGKTGTPSFPSDGVSLDELARLCPRGTSAAAAASQPTVARPLACSALRPYKWYVAAYRRDGAASGPWTHAIAVLSERNWLRASGQVHGAGDHGPNPSAEIALQIAGRQLGLLGVPAPQPAVASRGAP